MSDSCKQILNLFYYEKKSMDEIALILEENDFEYEINNEIFDKYGHILISSQTYSKHEDAIANMMRSLSNQDKYIAPCTAILWPSTVKVIGSIYR